MKNKKIVIAGGTGFIGQALAAHFGKQNHVVILSRGSVHSANNRPPGLLLGPQDGFNVTYWRWDGLNVERHWLNEMEGADLLINLAGKSVNCRYNARNKQEIFDSRLNPTVTLGKALSHCLNPPAVWMNASSATIYRHAEDRSQDEFEGEIHDDFSVQVCKEWEKSFFDAPTPGTRKIALRTAITLGRGGVMTPYLRLLKFGLGGKQGSGNQMYSWIHVSDLCRSIEWIYNKPELDGVINCCSPHPVANSMFMKTIRTVSGVRFGLPAPSILLKLGAAIIGTEPELILKSRWVLPTRLTRSGFQFRYAQLSDALQNIFSTIPKRQYRLF